MNTTTLIIGLILVALNIAQALRIARLNDLVDEMQEASATILGMVLRHPSSNVYRMPLRDSEVEE